MMNPLAQKLNDEIKQSSPEVLDMMSQLGKEMFYPKGILSQSAEAKRTTYNATIGMATKKKVKCMQIHLTKCLMTLHRMKFSHMHLLKV